MYESGSEIPLASIDAAQALQTLKDENTMTFDMWELQDPQQIDEENVHFGRFLVTAAIQSPQKSYSLDNMEILNGDGTKAFTEDITEYISEGRSELPDGIIEEWHEKYGDAQIRYDLVERSLTIMFYERALDDPKSALSDFVRFYKENKEILDAGNIREIYIGMFSDSEENAVEPYVGLNMDTVFETGTRKFYSPYAYSPDDTWEEEIKKKYEAYLKNEPEFAGMLKSD